MSFAHAREAAGLSQAEAAKAVGVSQSAICLWETDKTRPRAALLLKIAQVYHCSVEELLASGGAD